MAKRDQLRKQRKGTVINVTSAKQESDLIQAMKKVETAVLTALRNLRRLVIEKRKRRSVVADTPAHSSFACFVTPSSQEMEPPVKLGRFTDSRRSIFTGYLHESAYTLQDIALFFRTDRNGPHASPFGIM